MSQPNELRFDVATGLSLGAREAQEDSVLCDVPQGGGAGFLVLADGLGGHAGGALASRIAVTTAMREIAGQRDADGRLAGDIPGALQMAAEAANHAVLAQAEADAELRGMGTTLIVALVQGAELHWLSVGDSVLFLIRDGAALKLNETHSLAPHLDLLVEVGEMSAQDACDHPARNCLTSALGTEKIERIDCPQTPRPLEPGDMLLAASDGLLTLPTDDIAAILGRARRRVPPADTVQRLLQAVADAADTEQDNTSLALLHVAQGRAARARRRPIALLERVRLGWRAQAEAARTALLPARPE